MLFFCGECDAWHVVMYLCCAAVSEFVYPVGVYQNKNNVESEESSGDVFMVLSVVLYISLAVSAVFWLYNCFSYHPRTLGGPTAFPRLSSSYTCTICPLSSMFSGQGVHEKNRAGCAIENFVLAHTSSLRDTLPCRVLRGSIPPSYVCAMSTL